MLTPFTQRVLAQARARQFTVDCQPRGGRLVCFLSQPGREGAFGALYVGARTGRITGAVLYRGNHDLVGTRYRGARAAAGAIRESIAPGR